MFNIIYLFTMDYYDFMKTKVYRNLYNAFTASIYADNAEDILHDIYSEILNERGDYYFDYLERRFSTEFENGEVDQDILQGMFVWSDTKQGHEYWSLVNAIYKRNVLL